VRQEIILFYFPQLRLLDRLGEYENLFVSQLSQKKSNQIITDCEENEDCYGNEQFRR
jgi:hypothetical protein